MSDSEETSKKGPPPAEATDTSAAEQSSPEQPPPKNRSRSSSRRARRQKQSQVQKQKQKQQKTMPPPVEDTEAEDAEQDTQAGAQPAAAMQPFEHIGPDSTSMDGPVTYARAQRGEIPMRPGNPKQSLKTGNPEGYAQEDYGEQAVQPEGGGESDLMKQDGLKLRLELNLDIELELKAKIRGDLTLALLA